MINVDINWLPIVGASIASMVLGFAWYSQLLFGKEWMELMGMKQSDMQKAKKGMTKTFVVSILASLVMAFVLRQFIDLFYIVSYSDALQLGFWIWFGFVATTMVTEVLYGGKPWKLFVINSGYQLASIMAMAVILSYWA